eukprot:CAMPEP_0176143972 /NCGR_PEP_ID=MMETSP0120_2-20121206/73287_1 /TAXON_ID=160619 /ORGANISM="Kryptoperidinium foliaceum, Strain CCMP 1326" /LENGTH=747 /DNA_ID=CAMNT_0017480307 /DNA_START=35 /DNA_END=2278 /DNA_ORIENTATION=-
MANVDAFLRAAWEEVRATRGSMPLAVLVPKDIREEALASEDCPLQLMSGRLRDCEDVLEEAACRCAICSGGLAHDAMAMPTDCTETRKRLLMRIVAELAADFDPGRYTPGALELSGIVGAKLSASRRERQGRRQAARRVVRAAWLVRFHEASRKRCLRLDALRNSLGDAAFLQMVQDQVDRRRNKVNDGMVPTDAQLWQTTRWWSSREGQRYHRGPPRPHPLLVAPELQRRSGGPPAEGGGPTAALLGGGATATFRVPSSSVARFAAAAVASNMRLQGFMNRCLCSAVVQVDFDAASGVRVPRVHVAAGRGEDDGDRNGDDDDGDDDALALLDAASLENLRPGDWLDSPRRLVRVRRRVIALTGEEQVALALPRPHDQFDTVLRGPTPPSSLLPVGWDITNVAGRVVLEFRWTAAPFTPLTVVVVAAEAWEDGDEASTAARLQEELSRHHELAAGRLRVAESVLFGPARLLRVAGHLAMRHCRYAGTVCADALSAVDRRVDRLLAWLGRVALRPAWAWALRTADPALRAGRRCADFAWEHLRAAARSAWEASVDIASSVWRRMDRFLEWLGRVALSPAWVWTRRAADTAWSGGRRFVDFSWEHLQSAARFAREGLGNFIRVAGRFLADVRTWRSVELGGRLARSVAGHARRCALALSDMADLAAEGVCRMSGPPLRALSDAAGHAQEICRRVAAAVSSSSVVQYVCDAWDTMRQAVLAAWPACSQAEPPVKLARVRIYDDRHDLQAA